MLALMVMLHMNVFIDIRPLNANYGISEMDVAAV